MRTKWADCRLCIYFRDKSSMGGGDFEAAQRWVQRYRPGSALMGYCDFFRRPVTYYTGFCRGFTRKPVNSRTLLEFMG